jgi:hypothetical protein
MGRDTLALDTVLAAAQFFVAKWSPDLTRTQARDLLRFLICRWYDTGRGHLGKSPVKLSQGTLARKLGLSRQWSAILLQRLRRAGWLDYYAELLPDGMRGSCVLRIGRQFKRLLVMLKKATQPKNPVKPDGKSRWKFLPTNVEKKLLRIQQKEKEPPSERVLEKIPLLRSWLGRGTQINPE